MILLQLSWDNGYTRPTNNEAYQVILLIMHSPATLEKHGENHSIIRANYPLHNHTVRAVIAQSA
jgi:hypothetical protein